jgi:RNA polymerase sigma factor (sigma-70 family)
MSAERGPSTSSTDGELAVTDEELMARYCEGEEHAFRVLFERYAGLLLRVLSRDLGSEAAAEELVQQTFLQLHRARFDFDVSQRFKPWILTIALNLKREHFRRRRRRPTVELVEAGVPPREQERWEASSSVAWALERLPGDQREVIELYWFEGLSFADVARCLGIGKVAAKVRAHRGYVRLRTLLGAVDVGRNPKEEFGI